MTLEEFIVSRYRELEFGQRVSISENWCKHCLSEDVYMEVQLEADNPSGLLSGTQPKTTARKIYVLCCASCGRYSGDKRGTQIRKEQA